MNSRRSPRERRQRARGFGLLEALVALVLLSSVGFTLLAWIQQNLDTLQRMRGVYAETEARRTVLAWSRTLNPLERPTGEITLGGLRLTWQAKKRSDPVSQAGYPSGKGLHDLALYDVGISTFRSDERAPWFVQQIVCVGHRRVRDLHLPGNMGGLDAKSARIGG